MEQELNENAAGSFRYRIYHITRERIWLSDFSMRLPYLNRLAKYVTCLRLICRLTNH